jgi:hypothetical protein
MADHVKKIAQLLTEDPDVIVEKSSEITKIFKSYKNAWKRGSILSLSDFHKVAGALKKIAAKNGCRLDDSRLTVMLIPSGFVMKNIYIECRDVEVLQKLAVRLADQSGDPQMKHKFDKNLRVNLYNTINKDFANLVREKYNLEVTHQMMDIGPSSKVDRKDVLPMATITVPKVDVEPEEKVEEEPLPEPPGPLGGGETPEGGLGPEGALGPPGPPGGMESPPGPPGMEPPPEEGEIPPEEIEVEHIINIANIITEDPDIF